jgi:hypothetical protein
VQALDICRSNVVGALSTSDEVDRCLKSLVWTLCSIEWLFNLRYGRAPVSGIYFIKYYFIKSIIYCKTSPRQLLIYRQRRPWLTNPSNIPHPTSPKALRQAVRSSGPISALCVDLDTSARLHRETPLTHHSFRKLRQCLMTGDLHYQKNYGPSQTSRYGIKKLSFLCTRSRSCLTVLQTKLSTSEVMAILNSRLVQPGISSKVPYSQYRDIEPGALPIHANSRPQADSW